MLERDVVVYSCVTGRYDKVADTLLSRVGRTDPRVTYVLFTDQVTEPTRHQLAGLNSSFWNVVPLAWQHPLCRTRTARWHKVNSHLLPIKAKFSLWIDGTHRLKPNVDVYDLVDTATRLADLATFRHPDRDCVYQELVACKQWRKDNPLLMTMQVDRYKAEGYPAHAGLVETSCVVRKHTERVVEFNRAWWQQIDSGSYRDQLSFNYVARKLDFFYGTIPGNRLVSPYLEYRSHG
jgi:hypothetical protein